MGNPPLSSTDRCSSASSLDDLLVELQQLDVSERLKLGQLRTVGGFAEVYDGYLSVKGTSTGQKVAVKRFRIVMDSMKDGTIPIARELHVWSELHHINVLPLLGYTQIDGLPSLVSKWMDNGTIVQYMLTHPGIDVASMALEIANGLAYLHKNDVIHSDLKGDNVLVSPSGRPMLCDFGISRLRADGRTVWGTSSLQGSTRWMAIELLRLSDSSSQHEQFHTNATDVWAYGMVVYELLSLKFPFYQYRSEPRVCLAILSGEKPAKPTGKECNDKNLDSLWTKCVRCWDADPGRRPPMSELVSEITLLTPHLVQLNVRDRLIAHKGMIHSVAFSPDGRSLATASADMSIGVFGVETATLLLPPLTGHAGPVTSVIWSSTGESLVSVSTDKTARKWNTSSGSTDLIMEHSSSVLSVSASPDGQLVASGCKNGSVVVWDMSSGTIALGPLVGHKGPVSAVAYSPDGRNILSCSMDESICVWTAKSGQLLFGPNNLHFGPVTSVSYEPSGTFFVSASHDRTMCIWNAGDFAVMERNPTPHSSWVTSVQYSPNGRFILSTSGDVLRVTCAANGEVIGMFIERGVRFCQPTFSLDGILVAAGGTDGRVTIWNLKQV